MRLEGQLVAAATSHLSGQQSRVLKACPSTDKILLLVRDWLALALADILLLRVHYREGDKGLCFALVCLGCGFWICRGLHDDSLDLSVLILDDADAAGPRVENVHLLLLLLAIA